MHAGFIAPQMDVAKIERRAAKVGLHCYPLRSPRAANRGFALVDPMPTGGTLLSAIQAQLAAHGPEYKPHALFTARWCEPCRALVELFSAPALQAILNGCLLIMFDFDVWGDEYESVEMHVRSVSCIAQLCQDGKTSSRIVSGDAWEEDTIANVVKALGPFFAST